MKKENITALIIALGIALAGLFIKIGIQSLKSGERIVSVKGLSEREVNADHVTWPISVTGSANTTSSIYETVNKNRNITIDWLISNGLSKQDISSQAPEVTDKSALRYGSFDPNKEKRYQYTWTLTVSTDKVDIVRKLSQRTGELLNKGIAISSGNYDTGFITYEYTKLNEIKPEMIADATQNARDAANKFAKDSDSKVGKIKNANQGYFTINNRDKFTHYIKVIRVVTTVNYYLED